MGRQPSIVVGFLDQVLRARPLVVKPNRPTDRFAQVGHKNAIDVPGRLKQLVLLGFCAMADAGVLGVTQGNEPVRSAPILRLIPELRFLVCVRFWRGLPGDQLQLLDQAARLAGHDNELATELLVGLYRLPAVETGIRAKICITMAGSDWKTVRR